MKKGFKLLLGAVFFAASVAAVLMTAGCSAENTPSHSHTFASKWSNDETYHWHAATCEHKDQIKDGAEHVWDDGTDDQGNTTYTCTVCKATKTDKHTHTFSEKWSSDDTYHWHAATCVHTTEISEAAPHDWDGGTVVEDATVDKAGKKKFTCTVCGKTKTETIPAKGHTHTFANVWTSNETRHWHAATCGHAIVADAAAHTFGDWSTADASGDKTRTCTVCKYMDNSHDHVYSKEWTTNDTHHWHIATCEHTDKISGQGEHTWGSDNKCTTCGKAKPAAGHEHTFSDEWTTNETYHWHAATCEHKDEIKDGAAHDWGEWSALDEYGNKTRTCSVCQYKQTEHEHIYSEEWTITDYYHWHAAICGDTTEMKDEGAHDFADEYVVTKEATTHEPGYVEFKCKVCEQTVTFSWEIGVPEDAVSLDKLGEKAVIAEAELASYGITDTSTPAKIANATYYKFGVYPQTAKADDVTIDETIINLEFDAVDYYLGSDKNWYAKYYDKYKKVDKYYKVEPIVWRKLEETGCLLAEKALMTNVLYYGAENYEAPRTLGDTTIYANNYKYSNIRAWLNGIQNQFVTDGGTSNSYTVDWSGKGFLQTAFTESQIAQIKDTTVDNSADSTTSGTGDIEAATKYACADTTDKIFLLSRKEATAEGNGFEAYNAAGNGNSRQRLSTDYTKAHSYFACHWWLRSPYNHRLTDYVSSVANGGGIFNVPASTSPRAVVPALNLIEE